MKETDLYLDFSQFNQLKRLSGTDQQQALRNAAQQMESLFLGMMLKSMREANALFGEDSMFESRESRYYREMQDQQLVSNLSKSPGIGLADIIFRQLSHGDQRENVRPLTAPTATLSTAPTHPVRITADPDLKSGQVVESPMPNVQSWQNPEQFVKAIYPHAERAARQLNADPSGIVAQAALETGWGNHVMDDAEGNCSFNLFGIKADTRWTGAVTQRGTLEYRNGIAARETAHFRSYSSLKNAFEDFVDFLKSNSRYVEVISSKTPAKHWGFKLQDAGYATDPSYGKKIADVLDSDVLQSALRGLNL